MALENLERRLAALTAEEFGALMQRLAMRGGESAPKGAIVIVHWGTSTDAQVLLPITDDPSSAASVLREIESVAQHAVGRLLRPNLHA